MLAIDRSCSAWDPASPSQTPFGMPSFLFILRRLAEGKDLLLLEPYYVYVHGGIRREF